jgi:predicted nucleotidyltransferase
MSTDMPKLATRPPPSRPARRDEVIEALRSAREQIMAFHAEALFLYGSAARDEMRDDSDIDVFIDYDENGPFSFVELVRLGDLLKNVLYREVDVTTRRGLHPLLRSEIERSSIRVF